jgi:hypothetical protein
MELPPGFPSAKVSLSETLEIARELSVAMFVIVGGQKYSGRVKDHSPESLVLFKVIGKENYDVYIPLKDITSIEFEVRFGK